MGDLGDVAESPLPSASAASDDPAQTATQGSHVGDRYEVPAFEPHSSFTALKERIRHHYELASDYYYSLCDLDLPSAHLGKKLYQTNLLDRGQHIHHAYFLTPEDTKETGQVNLIKLLLDVSQLDPASTVLDVGCGIGGTTRYLAREHGGTVTGVTISPRQVQMAQRLTLEESSKLASLDSSAATPTSSTATSDADDFMVLGLGRVRYEELDAEKMEARFPPASFDCVWISEALSHFPDKALFFRNAARVLRPGKGKLVIADWFKAEGLDDEAMERDIKAIEDGMLLPPLCTQQDYVSLAEAAGLKVLHEPKDISQNVAKTWDISWTLVSSPSLWAFAISQGRDGLAFLQAFRAMRRGYANGTFRYAVMAFERQ